MVPDNIITLQAAREGGVYVASSLRLSTDAAPATHRELAGTNKIIPILTSYLVKAPPPLPRTTTRMAWDAQHAWGAERARRMVRDLGGFYTKVGQVAAPARR